MITPRQFYLNKANDRGVVMTCGARVTLLTMLLVSRGRSLRLRVIDVCVTRGTIREFNLHLYWDYWFLQ